MKQRIVWIVIAIAAFLLVTTIGVAYKHTKEVEASWSKKYDSLMVEKIELKAKYESMEQSSKTDVVDITITEPIKLGSSIVYRKARVKTSSKSDVKKQVTEALNSVQGLEVNTASLETQTIKTKEKTVRNGLLYFGLGAIAGAGSVVAVKKF